MKITESDKESRRELLELFTKVIAFFEKMENKPLMEYLKDSYQSPIERLEEEKAKLAQEYRPCPILVLGN